jgi:hypothetical protein
MDDATFWRKVKIGSDDECWPWTQSKTWFGHGRVWFRDKAWVAHRVAWVRSVGEIPDGLLVLHSCDNPPCCNPAHLFLGTNADNTHDMQAKGREHWSKRSHCKNGHDFAVHGRVRVRGNGKKYRLCVVCVADEQRRRRSRLIGV